MNLGWSIPTLLENEALVAVAKPEGLASIPERDPATPNLRRTLEESRGERLFVVHRLDKEVSGVMVFARSAAAHRELCAMFERRKVEKTYLALARGLVEKERLVVDAPLREFGSGRMGVHPSGKPSVTNLTVLARGREHTLLEVSPLTGRRHQIRAHSYSIGHPLQGDRRYGEDRQSEPGRLMLHALRLSLPLSSFGGPLSIEAPVPESFVLELERVGLGWPLATG